MVTTLASRSAIVNARSNHCTEQNEEILPPGEGDAVDADQPVSSAAPPSSRHRLTEHLQPRAKRT
jgi:hypothetical protein